MNHNSFFYVQFQRISVRRGSKRAYVAEAHSMLVASYHVLKEGVVFKDLGVGYYNQFNSSCLQWYSAICATGQVAWHNESRIGCLCTMLIPINRGEGQR